MGEGTVMQLPAGVGRGRVHVGVVREEDEDARELGVPVSLSVRP